MKATMCLPMSRFRRRKQQPLHLWQRNKTRTPTKRQISSTKQTGSEHSSDSDAMEIDYGTSEEEEKLSQDSRCQYIDTSRLEDASENKDGSPRLQAFLSVRLDELEDWEDSLSTTSPEANPHGTSSITDLVIPDVADGFDALELQFKDPIEDAI